MRILLSVRSGYLKCADTDVSRKRAKFTTEVEGGKSKVFILLVKKLTRKIVAFRI